MAAPFPLPGLADDHLADAPLDLRNRARFGTDKAAYPAAVAQLRENQDPLLGDRQRVELAGLGAPPA